MLAVFTLAATIILPLISKTRRHHPSMICGSNLKQIGLALRMYSGDHDGYFPLTAMGTDFEPLNQQGLLHDSKVYGCRSAETLMTTARQSNYLYMGSGLKEDDAHVDRKMLAQDQSHNHPGNEWMNFLFADGHVDYFIPD